MPGAVAIASVMGTAAATAGILAYGIAGRSSQMFGESVYRGPGQRRSLALTFDDGPSESTPILLDLLGEQRVPATFFQCGMNVRRHPAVARRVLHEGHEIGNHTVDHPNLINPPRSDSFICGELTRADQQIIAADGHTARPFFRPPYGAYNDQVRYLAAGLGYRTVYWSIDPRDWDTSVTTEDIINRVLNAPGLKPGAIILMHVNSPNEQYALDGVITGLGQRGYSIVPLSQLIS